MCFTPSHRPFVSEVKSFNYRGTSTHEFGRLHHALGRSRWSALVLIGVPEVSSI